MDPISPVVLSSTAKAVAMAVWTFQPFYSLPDAHRFMDSLPATACAQVAYGPAMTDAELADERARDAREKRLDEEERRDYDACQKLAAATAPIVLKDGDSGPPTTKQKRAYWALEAAGKGRAIATLRCSEPTRWMISSVSVLSSRWLVSYRAVTERAEPAGTTPTAR